MPYNASLWLRGNIRKTHDEALWLPGIRWASAHAGTERAVVYVQAIGHEIELLLGARKRIVMLQ